MDAVSAVTDLQELAIGFPWLRNLDPEAEWHLCPECGFLADSFDSTTIPWKPGKSCAGQLAEGRLRGHNANVHPQPLPRGHIPRPRKRFGGKRQQDLLYVAYSYRLGRVLFDEVVVVDRGAWKRYHHADFELPRGSSIRRIRPVSDPELPLESGAIRESVRHERAGETKRKRKERAKGGTG